MANTPKPVFKSLRRKLWWQRWSISPARMTIKNHLPWPLRVLLIAVVLGLSGAIAMWTYDLGRSFTAFKPAATAEQLIAVQEQVREISAERDRFQTTVNAAESQLNIERSVQTQLQGGKSTPDFTGNYQLILTLVQEGKSAMMTFPKSDATDKFKLSFKHYQRVEGVLTLPEGAIVKSVQIKILERGAMRAQQSVNL
jgi:FlaG/FlaF family flagellin (archaellin)